VIDELTRIPAKFPQGQMAWLLDHVKRCSREGRVVMLAFRIQRMPPDERPRAIYELVKALPNFQQPGGWWTHTFAATTIDKGGSCADKTTLIGALADRCGIAWKPVWFKMPPELGAGCDHVAPQLCGDGWSACYWADAAWTHGRFGDSPDIAIAREVAKLKPTLSPPSG
jgi:hypothetical protein